LRILVTGGFGFLGGRIVQYFLGAGHEVLLGTSRDVKSHNSSIGGAQVVQTLWNNPAALEKVCASVDVIIHASGMNAKDCIDDPASALTVNAVATANILQSAIKQKVCRFLYISTIHVYTDILEGAVSEDDCPTNLHPYATSHRAAEDAVLWAQKAGHIDGVVVRFSNGFGFPAHRDVNCWMLLINDLCRQAVEKRELVLASNGMQVRNFIPISEICSAIDFLVCQMPFEKKIGLAGAINVGGKESFTVLEMAKLVQSRCSAILGFTPDLLVGRIGGECRTQLDFQLNRLNSLGYSHLHSSVEEIDRLLAYCDNSFSRD